MDKEHLLAHVENLAPGLVTVLFLAIQVPASTTLVSNTKVLELLQQQFIAGLLLIAVAYLLGVAIFVVSRLVFDTLSALTVRPVLLKLFRWKDFDSFNPMKINARYRLALNAALAKDKDHPIRQEVVTRRQRGRLIRTLMIPAEVLAYPSSGLLGATLALVALLVLYAYAEVSIYQEARIEA